MCSGCGLVGFEAGDAAPRVDVAELDASGADVTDIADVGPDTSLDGRALTDVSSMDAPDAMDASVDAPPDTPDAGIAPGAIGFGAGMRILDMAEGPAGIVLVGDAGGDAYVVYCTSSTCTNAVRVGVAGASPTETMAAVASGPRTVYAVGSTRMLDAAILYQSDEGGSVNPQRCATTRRPWCCAT